MISQIIDLIDADNDLLRKKWGLCKTLIHGEEIDTGKYLKNGNWQTVGAIDKEVAVSYWKLDGEVTQERVRDINDLSNEPEYEVVYPLVQRVFVKVGYLSTDDACTEDDIYYMLQDRVNDLTRAQRISVGVLRGEIEFTGYTDDRADIMAEDFGIEDYKSLYNFLVLSLSCTVTVRVNQRCLTDVC